MATYESSAGSGGGAFIYANNKQEIVDKLPGFVVYDLEIDNFPKNFNSKPNVLEADIENLTGWLKNYYQRTDK